MSTNKKKENKNKRPENTWAITRTAWHESPQKTTKHDDPTQTKGEDEYLYTGAGEHRWGQSTAGLKTRHRWQIPKNKDRKSIKKKTKPDFKIKQEMHGTWQVYHKTLSVCFKVLHGGLRWSLCLFQWEVALIVFRWQVLAMKLWPSKHLTWVKSLSSFFFFFCW